MNALTTESGPRVYIVTKSKTIRIHHGAAGALLAGVGLIGLALILHDWKDRPWRFYD